MAIKDSNDQHNRPGNDGSTLIAHNIAVGDKRTSIRLEKEMWIAFKDIARNEKCSIHALCTMVSAHKKSTTSLTSAVRIFILAYFKAAASPEGHIKAGHGRGEGVVVDLLKQHIATPYYGLREYKSFNN